MTSGQKLELMRRLLDVFTRRDRVAWFDLCDPEVEWFPPAEWPEAGPIRGAAAVWDFIVTLDEPWEEGAYEIAEVIDPGGERFAGLLNRTVRGRSSGVAAEFEYWNLLTFRGGKLLRSQWFGDRAGVLEAAGLRE